jgi:hypothetical protein
LAKSDIGATATSMSCAMLLADWPSERSRSAFRSVSLVSAARSGAATTFSVMLMMQRSEILPKH